MLKRYKKRLFTRVNLLMILLIAAFTAANAVEAYFHYRGCTRDPNCYCAIDALVSNDIIALKTSTYFWALYIMINVKLQSMSMHCIVIMKTRRRWLRYLYGEAFKCCVFTVLTAFITSFVTGLILGRGKICNWHSVTSAFHYETAGIIGDRKTWIYALLLFIMSNIFFFFLCTCLYLVLDLAMGQSLATVVCAALAIITNFVVPKGGRAAAYGIQYFRWRSYNYYYALFGTVLLFLILFCGKIVLMRKDFVKKKCINFTK